MEHTTTTEVLPDGAIRVAVTANGQTNSAICSSFHLVGDKEQQLIRSLWCHGRTSRHDGRS